MVEDVVNSIIEAEDKAKQKIAQAEEQATKIVEEAEKLADTYQHRNVASNRQKVVEFNAKSQEKANQKAEEQLNKERNKVDESLKENEKRLPDAIKYILENIV